MSLNNQDLLKHILDEINFIMDHTFNMSELEFKKNTLIQHAVIRSLEVIGEASKKIEEDFKKQYPLIEWKEMAGMRDKLIHDYFGVDYDIVWKSFFCYLKLYL